MDLLFTLGAELFDPALPQTVRPSVRAILLYGERIAMVHSLKYDYYKFPGGGIEEGEGHMAALCREVAEEAGLTLFRETVRPYGLVRRYDRLKGGELFVQDNFYYLAEAQNGTAAQTLDEYEAEERFTLEYVLPEDAIAANRKDDHGPKSRLMIEREALVLERLIREGYFPKR